MLDRGGRRFAVQEPEDEGEHERDDSPQKQTSLAAIGPYRSKHDRGAGARAECRHVPRQIAVARVGVRSRESEPAQLRLDRSPARTREDIDARAGGVERQRVGEAGASCLDLVALRALGFELPH